MQTDPNSPVRRPNRPKNKETLFAIPAKELALLFPIDPAYAVVGAIVHPGSGALILQAREDGVPTEDPPLSGGRFQIAIEEEPAAIESIAEDLIQYFRNRGVKADIGFYASANTRMKIIRSREGDGAKENRTKRRRARASKK